jgi:hypothetical protein
MNMGNKKVDKCRLERAEKLGKGREGGRRGQGSARRVVASDCLRLAFDSVMCCTPPLDDVGLSRGFALHLRIGRARRLGSGEEVVVQGTEPDQLRREHQSRD